jgi:CHRD domain/RTX calcium-binding nonapeptide repeat (4 copies)
MRTKLATLVALALVAPLLVLVSPGTGQGACFGSAPTITGSGEINGTAGDDVIVGSEGNDRIRGFTGNDKICGAGGDDRIGGGPGTDEVDGGAGNDQLDSGSGTDTVRGGDGDDVINCGTDTDTADGGPGLDTARTSGDEACETVSNAVRLREGENLIETLATRLSTRQQTPRPRGTRRSSGRFTATLSRTEASGTLAWRLTFRRLTGRAVVAHIHRGARGRAGQIIARLCGPCRSGTRGNARVRRESHVRSILDGATYVDIHTRANRRGEIRGQISRVPQPSAR